MGMSELARQSSRYREVVDFLVREVKLLAASADGYALRLVDDGYDTIELLLELDRDVLTAEYDFHRPTPPRAPPWRLTAKEMSWSKSRLRTCGRAAS